MSSPRFWYYAGGDEAMFRSRIQNDDRLEVLGLIFDEVVWISDHLVMNNVRSNSRLWEPSLLQSGGDLYIDVLWERLHKGVEELGINVQKEDLVWTLVRGHPYDKSPTEPRWHHEAAMSYRKSMRSAFRTNLSTSDTSLESANAMYFEKKLVDNCDLRIVVTSNGRIGMIPDATRVGDVCCVFLDVRVPFILAHSQNGRYKLVGGAYIHGVMAGELVEPSHDAGGGAEGIILD